MSPRRTLAEAKERLTILDLWRIFDLPGDPRKNPTHCPWREDRNASLSISPDGRLFNDFATGEGGDAVDFHRRCTGLDAKAACRAFIELAGGSCGGGGSLGNNTGGSIGEAGNRPSTPAVSKAPEPTSRPLPDLSALRLHPGTPADHAALAALRRVSVDAVGMAAGAGMLAFGTHHGRPAWVVLDKTKRNAQARRMDGQPWAEIGAKAWTLAGSHASWPLGAGTGEYPVIALVEGGPDMLAAFELIIREGRDFDVCPVAMLGASQRIHADALPLLAGKRIRIFAHNDTSGHKAARRWCLQLRAVGCTVDACVLGKDKDLNDFIASHASGPYDAVDARHASLSSDGLAPEKTTLLLPQ